jgi:hypothetical protein
MNKRKFTSAIYCVSAIPKLERTVVILILSNFHVGHRRPGCLCRGKNTIAGDCRTNREFGSRSEPET